MNSLCPHVPESLKRSPRTRTRKNSICADTIVESAHTPTSTLVRQKTRPPPLQIIPELSENESSLDNHSPATARPFQFVSQHSSCITLSSYAFSIDDALLMLGNNAPRSPALSVSSSSTDITSSDHVPTTPSTSDDDDEYSHTPATPRFRPRRISIRPLRITKTRSLICKEEDNHICLESHDEEDAVALPATDEQTKFINQFHVTTELAQEPEQDFYVREFQDFITLSPAVPFFPSPARRDSLTIVVEASPVTTETRRSAYRGRSRHSKPLPLPPPVTPPVSSFPLVPTFSLVQTTAHNSVVRRRRNIPSFPSDLSPHSIAPREVRSVPLNIGNCLFSEELLNGSIVTELIDDIEEGIEEHTSRNSQSPFAFTRISDVHPFQLAVPETPISTMYGDVILPRSSTDSDAPRSSIDSNSSFASSASSNTSASASCEDDEPECSQRLRSRWSSSTLGSLSIEPSRATALFSPIKSVLHSRTRCAGSTDRKVSSKMPPYVTPPRLPKAKRGSSAAASSTQTRHVRQQGSRSSTSSSGTSSAERSSHEGSPVGLKRKPIPMLMFLRST